VGYNGKDSFAVLDTAEKTPALWDIMEEKLLHCGIQRKKIRQTS
jgi:hypothetical protein